MSLDKNIVTDYLCPINGTSNCRSAFLAFKADAQGLDSTLTIPAHTYQFHTNAGSNADNYLFEGIANLTVSGYGATLGDNGGTGGFSLGAQGVGLGSPASSARIASTKAGQVSVTLISIGDASLFTVGRWIAIGSFDVQGFGQPPNPFFFEYAQIAGISGAVITLAEPLKYYHLSTYPLYDAGDTLEPDQGGPATIYVLPASWGLVNFEFRGITIDQVAQTYARGRHVTYMDVVCLGTSGIIPTQNQIWETDNYTGADCSIEVDKMIELMVMKNSSVRRIEFQSGAPNLFVADKLTVTQNINGTPRNSVIKSGSVIADLRLGATSYGRSDTIECIDSTISALTTPGYSADVSGYSVDQGTITLSGSTPIPFAMPGTRLMFNGTKTSELIYHVIDCAQEGSQTRVKTSIPNGVPVSGGWPNLPKSGGTLLKVGPHPAPFINFRNCVGCADVVDLSQLGAQAKPIYCYSKRTYTGNTLVSPDGVNLWGLISQIIITVLQAYTGTQGTLTLKPLGQFQANALDPPNYSAATTWGLTINLKVAGTRTITATSVTGSQSGDTLTAPGLIWFADAQTPFCNADISGEASNLWPIVQIEMFSDQGIKLPGKLR